MAETLISRLRLSLPEDVALLVESHLQKVENGDHQALLTCSEARLLLGHEESANLENVKLADHACWNDFIFRRLEILLADRSKPDQQVIFFCVGYAAFLAFVQANVTGPPLTFDPDGVVFPTSIASSQAQRKDIRQQILNDLSIDGIAAYRLVPNLELLALAETIFSSPIITKNLNIARWAKARVAFMHQKLLPELSNTLQNNIYDDLELLDSQLLNDSESIRVDFLLERAAIHLHNGLDKLAQPDLEQAKLKRHFDFALTGLLGKRTKYQENAVSQLVVLAKSQTTEADGREQNKPAESNGEAQLKPTTLDLNDDTLLESITFSEQSQQQSPAQVEDIDNVSASLRALDPANQPQLHPLDSAILLLLASSITNTSPQNGLTREETLPYASRVLEGGSSNWQVYTQALLVRSRIEGYRPRTVERGLLQLQALVDQVIADTSQPITTTADTTSNPDGSSQTSTFLPRPKTSESAPASERLRYVFQLATPTRWELEAELASRWVQLGGLRSALDIYERLEMWAEAALCWAATDREDKAKRTIRRQLFHATAGGPNHPENDVSEEEEWKGPQRDPPPLDAPRLYCILGDIDHSVEMYEQAWNVSKERYARAQRSIGKYYIAKNDFLHAAEAYGKSLKVNQLNHTSWFALGCALLELAQFQKAVEAFSRCVQLDDSDAEAWSNLGAAILRTETDAEPGTISNTDLSAKLDDEEDDPDAASAPTDHRQAIRADALKALKRAAALKRDSYRIWENVLVVAASLSPPDVNAILAAQKRLIDLRGPTDGEKCLDVDILEQLVLHLLSSGEAYDPSRPGPVRMAVRFFDDSVVPLITGSARLWHLVSRLALWRNRPSTALDAEEKAWRAVTSQPGWETDSEKRWDEVVESTVRLCDSYESLGPKERTEGMGAGEPVMKDWKFKARSAVRGILGRGKESWEDTAGWDRLKEVMEGLKG